MITLTFPIALSPDDQKFIGDIQRAQSPIVRCAYKQASYGLAEISVREEVRNRFSNSTLDSWFQQSAVKSGIGMFKADHETKRETRVFGGKKNFVRRCKGLITQDQWRELRLLPVYLIGESPQKGNRKFEFNDTYVIFKPWKNKQIRIELPQMRENWAKLWNQAVVLAEQKALPITVSLTKDRIMLSFDDAKVKKELKKCKKSIKSRYAGVDLNPNYIGVSVFDGTRLIDTKIFSFASLTGKGANENKIEHETREVAHAIGKWLQHLQVDKLFVEQLDFKQGSIGKGKNVNRLCKNQWKKTTFTSILRKFYKLYEVNAAYSSTIGNVLNPNLPDPIAASTEIARRGYEIIIQKSKKFYPALPPITHLEDLWKETNVPGFSNWKELHDWIKNSGLKYRVPLPRAESFRKFQSPASLVGVI